MTDYLELAAGEAVDVLLEAERRLAALRLSFFAEERGDARTESGSASPASAAAGESRTEKARRQASGGQTALERGRTEASGAGALLEQFRRTGSAGLGNRLGELRREEAELPGPESPWSAFAVWEEGAANARPALLEQMERAERSADAAGFEAQTGRARAPGRTPEASAVQRAAGGFPAPEERADASWTASGPRDSGRWSEEDLAVRLDRSFQRDGRRYDGGFYFY